MLTRWDPFKEIARLHDQMARSFGEGRSDVLGEAMGGGFFPAVDVFDEKDAVTLKAEVPGMKPEDVKIQVENDVLTLSGERKLEREDKKDGYLRVERSYGSFTRSFALPKGVDADKIEAAMNDGVLSLRIPKQPAPEPKRIDVKPGARSDRKQITAS